MVLVRPDLVLVQLQELGEPKVLQSVTRLVAPIVRSGSWAAFLNALAPRRCTQIAAHLLQHQISAALGQQPKY